MLHEKEIRYIASILFDKTDMFYCICGCDKIIKDNSHV